MGGPATIAACSLAAQTLAQQPAQKITALPLSFLVDKLSLTEPQWQSAILVIEALHNYTELGE